VSEGSFGTPAGDPDVGGEELPRLAAVDVEIASRRVVSVEHVRAQPHAHALAALGALSLEGPVAGDCRFCVVCAACAGN
jgi:hypothetical protein